MYKTYYFLESAGGTDPFLASGAAAVRWVEERLPLVDGFTQARPAPEQIARSAEPPFAGIVEVWHARLEHALDPRERAIVAGCLARGARIADCYTGLARTVMRLPAQFGSDAVKGVFPFRRKVGLSVDAFRRRWWHGHGPIAARTEHALLYLQCHPIDESYAGGAEPRFDGVTELHWPSLALARRAMASEQMRVDQASDSPDFAAAASVLLFMAQEEIVRAP